MAFDFLEWSEFEDPNMVSTTLHGILKNLGMPLTDVPASKLRHGAGEVSFISVHFTILLIIILSSISYCIYLLFINVLSMVMAMTMDMND
jgi:hypothetical protein